MQQDVLAGPMRVPQLQKRRNNLSSLEATLELITRVQQSQAAIQVRHELLACFAAAAAAKKKKTTRNPSDARDMSSKRGCSSKGANVALVGSAL